MRTKKNLIKASTIVGYVTSFIYILLTACYFALSNSIFWLFLVLAAISLYSSLYSSCIRRTLDEEKLEGKLKRKFLINTIISLVSPISFTLNIIAYLWKKEDRFIEVLNPNYKIENKEKKDKKFFKKANFVLTVTGLVAVIAGSFTANIAETSAYSVKVRDFTLTKEMTEQYNAGDANKVNGKNYVIENSCLSYGVTEYKPKQATQENPLPVIFVMPGFTRTKATMAQYAIELSKRGSVVFVLDPGCQGATTYGGYTENENGEKEQVSSTVGANGLDYLVQYVFNNTDDYTYIDRDNFGAVGHSAGGGNVGQLAQDFAGSSYEESIIKSVYLSGYIKNSLANRFKSLRCNAAMSYAYYDEGAFRYQSDVSSFELVAKRFVNEVNGKELGIDKAIIDYEYGDMNNGTYRVVHREETNHCFEMYDALSISNTINFFRRTLNLKTNLSDNSHTWMFKEGSNGIALVGAFIFIISLMSLVIDVVPLFKSFKVSREVSKNYEVEQKVKYGTLPTNDSSKLSKKRFIDKVIFWSVTALSAIIACLDYIPLARLSMDLFPDAAVNNYTFFFPARMMNAVMLWAVVNGLIGFILVFGVKAIENLVYKLTNHPEYISWYRFKQMKINWKDLLLTLGLVIGLFLIFYGMDQLMYIVFHQDFRFMLISASPLQPRFIVTWLIYLIPFFIFYLSNSVRVNLSVATEGWSETKTYIASAIFNSIGLAFIIVINYVCYFKTGTVFYGYYSPKDTSEMWLYINMVFGIIPMMFVLPIINRFAYKKSGNVYLGALLTVMIFIMMSLSASVSYIPM